MHPKCLPVPIRLYDCSILNIQERREHCLDFDTIEAAARFLGVWRNSVHKAIGRRIRSKTDGKEYAVRVGQEAKKCA